MRAKIISGSAVVLIIALLFGGMRYKNAHDNPSGFRDAVADGGAVKQLLSAGEVPAFVPAAEVQPAKAATTLMRGRELLNALHKQTTLNGKFKARIYSEARFFMYSRANVIEKDGVQGIVEMYSQLFLEGVSGADNCHMECEDANGDGRINFEDYIEADRDRCLKNEPGPPDVHPQTKCKAGLADLNHDGKPGDSVNTEHLWPRTRFGNQEELVGDIYNLQPAFAVTNEKRDETPYGPGGFMPPEEIRGQVARAMFYFAATYHDKIEKEDGQVFFSGMIPGLMEWNRRYPPDEAEIKRNELVSGFQGNRNPFIDDPALADQVGQAAWSKLFR